MRKQKRALPYVSALTTLIVASYVAVGCQTSPTGRKQLIFVPESQMSAMGAQAFSDMKAKEKVENDPATNTYVKCIANAITTVLDEKQNWEVVVFKDETPNAFALPGGKIGVHTGMLKVASNAAQLAAVIGHEVGHVLAHHGSERVSEQFAAQGGLALVSATLKNRGPKYDLLMASLGVGAQFGLLLPHSRTQESEADVIGLDLMAKAGFDPKQAVELWRNMARAGGVSAPEFFSTHPSNESRIENLQANLADPEKTYQGVAQKPNCQR